MTNCKDFKHSSKAMTIPLAWIIIGVAVRPVALWTSDPLPPLMLPTFATPNTMLTIPLSRRALLVSRLEDLVPESFDLDAVNVAMMNTFRAMSANQIYSAQENWAWTVNGEIQTAQAYLDGLPPIESKTET